jgi:hypothetical protein
MGYRQWCSSIRGSTGEETTPQIHRRSTQAASGKNESLLGCEEEGCGEAPIEGSEQA